MANSFITKLTATQNKNSINSWNGLGFKKLILVSDYGYVCVSLQNLLEAIMDKNMSDSQKEEYLIKSGMKASEIKIDGIIFKETTQTIESNQESKLIISGEIPDFKSHIISEVTALKDWFCGISYKFQYEISLESSLEIQEIQKTLSEHQNSDYDDLSLSEFEDLFPAKKVAPNTSSYLLLKFVEINNGGSCYVIIDSSQFNYVDNELKNPIWVKSGVKKPWVNGSDVKVGGLSLNESIKPIPQPKAPDMSQVIIW